jgi:hypothetical protein
MERLKVVKENIKKNIRKNSYINYYFYKSKCHFENNKILNLNRIMNDWDTILDVTQLKKFRDSISHGERFNTSDPNFANAFIYGIAESIFGKFCNVNNISLPAVEHGLIFHDQIFNEIDSTCRPSFVTFGSFRKKIIQKYLYRPVFCIGPYIHYAHQFYDKSKFLSFKKKLGKTLLVFPTHSTDTSEVSYQEEKFCKEIRHISKDFDSVLVNTFWWNINDSLTERLSAEGYHICSAGFREDKMFLSRLKTIINLADLAVGDGIGTHLGYCISEGVPFYLMPVDTKVQLYSKSENVDLSFVEAQTGKIRREFANFCGEVTCEQKKVCNPYWGLNSLKSKKEIAIILEINNELFSLCHGNMSTINHFAHKLLDSYFNKDELKYSLLKAALERNFQE